MKQSAYLIIDSIVFLIALVLSLDSKPNYYKHWKSIIVALVGTTLTIGFLEVYFVSTQVLSFDKLYVSSNNYYGLPLEEWLSVFAFSFITTVVFQWLKVYTGRYYKSGGNYAFIGIGLFLVIIGNMNFSHIYTIVLFLSSGILLLLHVILFRSKYTGTFMFAFLVVFAMFITDRLVLARLPVITIKDLSTSAVRFYGMPLEDMVFILLLCIVDITLFEFSKKILEGRRSSGRSSRRKSSSSD